MTHLIAKQVYLVRLAFFDDKIDKVAIRYGVSGPRYEVSF